jgi:microcystin-dependent protein
MDQILGQIQAFGFNFTPRGWAFCNGQLMSVSQNTALFALLGTTFGGDGISTFGLPDLRGRTIVHPGQGTGLTPVNWGEKDGADKITLNIQNIPLHSHPLVNGTAPGQVNAITVLKTATGIVSNEPDGGANTLASGGSSLKIYTNTTPTTDTVGGISTTISGSTGIIGDSSPFVSRNPYLGIYTSIALTGMFPSRD